MSTKTDKHATSHAVDGMLHDATPAPARKRRTIEEQMAALTRRRSRDEARRRIRLGAKALPSMLQSCAYGEIEEMLGDMTKDAKWLREMVEALISDTAPDEAPK